MSQKDFSFNPPINTALADQKGNATKPWSSWFGNIFQTPTRDKQWIPTLSGVTGTGSFTIVGSWNRIGPVVYFSVLITPASSNTTASGATITNFPFNSVFGQSTAFNVSTRQGISSALGDTVISVPNWSSLSAPVQITGWAQVGR